MRFLLSTWGSKGDLYPFLSLGKALRRRGHAVTLAGNPAWEDEATRDAGLDFLAAGPRQTAEFLATIPETASAAGGGRVALAVSMEKWFSPAFSALYRTLRDAAPRHDCLVMHHAVLVADAVAEATGIPWVSVVLAPCVVPSAYTLPIGLGRRPGQGLLGRNANTLTWRQTRRDFAAIAEPYLRRFRDDNGLPPLPAGRDAALDTSFSPEAVLALFSAAFCPPAPDWPPHVAQAGFCFWDPLEDYTPPTALLDFLAAGKGGHARPVLVTLGTTIATNPQGFYEAAVEAVRGTSHRAILALGKAATNAPANLPKNVFALDYAPFGWLMPRCVAVMHQCGVGTSAQALRAGLPSVCCPYSFDQPNNARQLEALGVGVYLSPGAQHRSPESLRRALDSLLAGGAPARAATIAAALRKEDGPTRACEILERFVQTAVVATTSRRVAAETFSVR